MTPKDIDEKIIKSLTKDIKKLENKYGWPHTRLAMNRYAEAKKIQINAIKTIKHLESELSKAKDIVR